MLFDNLNVKIVWQFEINKLITKQKIENFLCDATLNNKMANLVPKFIPTFEVKITGLKNTQSIKKLYLSLCYESLYWNNFISNAHVK